MPHKEMHRITPGKVVFVTGFVPKDAKSFSIDFVADDDIAFRFKSSFDDKAIIRNSRQNGDWKEEEKDGKFFFGRDHMAEIIFLVHDKQFQALVDGVSTYFNHRIQPKEITAIAIDGDIDLFSVLVRG